MGRNFKRDGLHQTSMNSENSLKMALGAKLVIIEHCFIVVFD